MDNSVIDLIIRIKNGYMSRRETIESPFSRFREETLKKFKELGYIKNYSKESDIIKKFTIELLYKDGIPAITDIAIKSTSGRRIYVSYKELKPIVNNFGCSIISTSRGILTNKEARKQKVGGELLFNIW